MKDNHTSLFQPTLDNMRRGIDELVRDARPGDHLFFYFAGHATQVQDLDGDEEDGRDEVLISSDGRGLVDDELHERLVKRVPSGCCLTALFDCCNSGTSLDLPYNEYTRQRRPPLAYRGRPKYSDGHVVLLAACEDGEDAIEGRLDGRAHGMFTQEVVRFLTAQKDSSFRELLASVSRGLQTKDLRNQHPQLSSSHMIDLKARFCL